MNAKRPEATATILVLAFALSMSASTSYSGEAAIGFDAAFFSLDGVYDFSVSDAGAQPEEGPVVSSRSPASNRERLVASAIAEPEPTEQLDVVRRPQTLDGSSKRGRSFYGISRGGVFKTFGIGLFVASGADLVSTELGLSRPEVFELNPTQEHRALRVGTHVVAPAFMWWVTEKVHRDGKPKLALIMRIGFAVAYSYAVMHNVRTMSNVP